MGSARAGGHDPSFAIDRRGYNSRFSMNMAAAAVARAAGGKGRRGGENPVIKTLGLGFILTPQSGIPEDVPVL